VNHAGTCGDAMVEADAPVEPRLVSIFEAAVDAAEHMKVWANWSDNDEIARKSIWLALVLLSVWGGKDQKVAKFLEDALRNPEPIEPFAIYRSFWDWKENEVREATSFIHEDLTPEEIEERFHRYEETDGLLSIVAFVLFQKPCCRLKAIAWLLPWVPQLPNATLLFAYAGEQLASLMNDPNEPYRPDCTMIGNSWLHRLGVFLLQQCEIAAMPPPASLVRLVSLVSVPSGAGTKAAKATRMYDYLSLAKYPLFLHEAPPAQAIGKALALELLDELDPNRQEQHFRRIERAVAHYATGMLAGTQRSARSVQKASGLSWSDSKHLMKRPFFYRLVFEHQCRHIVGAHHARDCPECRKLRQKYLEGELTLESS
jgi:hypothetical protein